MVPFTVEEIKKTVFCCEGNKSLGADGFSMAFFRKNWNLIKVDLERVFKELFERGNTRLKKRKVLSPISHLPSLFQP